MIEHPDNPRQFTINKPADKNIEIEKRKQKELYLKAKSSGIFEPFIQFTGDIEYLPETDQNDVTVFPDRAWKYRVITDEDENEYDPSKVKIQFWRESAITDDEGRKLLSTVDLWLSGKDVTVFGQLTEYSDPYPNNPISKASLDEAVGRAFLKPRISQPRE